MNRKEFLNVIAALGGASLLPASFVNAVAATPVKRDRRRIDPCKAVLLSDIHICGEFKEDGTPIKYPYNPTSLNLRIDKILKMRPLPANVIIFGDVAWDYGLEEDYVYAKKLLSPLEEAGIKVTMTLGNHDRRAPFFKVFPKYAERTPVPGRAVSVVSLPDVDIVMLDSLAELPDLKPKQKTTVSGELDAAQVEWLRSYLSEGDRPVIVGAHHMLQDMPALSKLMTESNRVMGYIHGHKHVWNRGLSFLRPRKPVHMVPIVGLPATFYGDIGFVVMQTDSEKAVMEFSSEGFWWPQPVENPPVQWKQREEDLKNEKCIIRF